MKPEFLWDGPSLLQGYRALGSVDTHAPTEMARLLNVRLDRKGIEKRGGYSVFQKDGTELTGGGTVNSLYCTSGTSQKKVIATANNRIFGIAADGTVTVIKSGAPAGAFYDFCEYRDAGTVVVVGYTASGYAFKWDSVAAAVTDLVGPGVACGVVMAHNGRIFVATGQQIYVTSDGTVDTYPALSSVRLDSDDSEGALRKMVPCERNFAVLLLERGMYAMQGSDTGTETGTPDIRAIGVMKVGCPSTAAVVKIRDEIYFFGVEDGQYGFFSTDGVDVTKLSRNIQDDVDRVNTSALTTACAVKVGSNVLFALPLDGAANTTLMFLLHRDLRGRPWTTWQFTKMPRCFAMDRATGTMYFGRQDGGYVMKHLPTTYDDAGEKIDMDWITGSVPFSDDGVEVNQLRDLEFHADVVTGGEIAVSYGRDRQAPEDFTAFAHSPVSIATPGSFGGDAGGNPAFAWPGTVRSFLHGPKGLPGHDWRFRFRSNNTKYARISRVRARAHEKSK